MALIKKLQAQAWRNKIAKGFNTTNVDREFNYTYAELAEAYEAYRRGLASLGEELADTVIFLMGMAEMLGVDLEAEIIKKMEINEQREYVPAHGHHVKKETK